MTQPHEEILHLIESVDPNDTAALDEIDARVHCYINKWPFERMANSNKSKEFIATFDERGPLRCGFSMYAPEYTRSRDALKAIRPDGWTFHVDATAPEMGVEYVFSKRGIDVKGDLHRYHPYGEELAELHAIIQAIAYERSKQ